MIEQYISKQIECSCGKVHKSRVEKIVIKKGVINNEFIEFLKQNNYNKLTVVCDKNTFGVAGDTVCKALDNTNIKYKLHIFNDNSLAPDERSVGNLAMGMDTECDIVVAVGSGTINDVCRYVSAITKKPFCTIGTAPSMDGYISGGSALIYNNFKLTFETNAPKAVFFEPEIIASAPKNMIASGVGDLLGKISCLSDWKLSKIVNNEWHCEFISDIVEKAIEKTVMARDEIASGDDKAVSTLIEALLLSGVCMDYAGNSRPASGCEHHMSHFVEMRYLLEGRKAVFHGTKVGINTIIALKAHEYISKLTPDFDKIRKAKRMSFEDWEKQICDAFLGASKEIIDLEKSCGKNSSQKLSTRLDSIEANWENIKNLSQSIAKPDVVLGILTQLNAPTSPVDIGVEKHLARQMIMYSKELRDRYTVLQLLWDLDELENFANLILDEYYK